MVEQQEIEKLSLSELEIMKKSFDKELENLEFELANIKLAIERVNMAKSIINKQIFLTNENGNSIFKGEKSIKVIVSNT